MEMSSPAKINLSLAVTGRRRDGYHDIFSVTFALDFCDTLTVAEAERACDGVTVLGSPLDIEKNTVATAIEIFRRTTGIGKHFSVKLEKNIPMEAGFGGGSSNGATALKALNAICGNVLPSDELAKVAVEIGADCPFFIHCQPAVLTGIGDVSGPLDREFVGAMGNYDLLIFKPAFGVKTAEAYGGMSAEFGFPMPEEEARRKFSRLRDALVAGSVHLPLFNSFAPAFFARHGALRSLCGRLEDSCAANVSLTGSGSGFLCLIHRSIDGGVGKAEEIIRRSLGAGVFLRRVSIVLESR
jgi:4-diphosphocytidyl-2-C-methyl-D-erythritol kinase